MLTESSVVEALPRVVRPVTVRVPVVDRFSSPKLIAPVSELMLANLTVPVEEAVVKVESPVTDRVPVVEIFEPIVVVA